jgi:hypothetical protein
MVTNNYFPSTFGYQFITLFFVLAVFTCLLIITDRMIHNPTAILLRRKKIIFPVRLICLFFNVLLLSSLIQLITVGPSVPFQPYGFVLGLFGASAILIMLVGVAVISNWKNYQVDDPNYYVLL